ncbi:MAG: hypothetical protein JSS02_13620 [Planctomycetes bacterium]|nr:hypothetical protein [Planctomycetota bacterium]
MALGAREMRPGGLLNSCITGLGDFSSQSALKQHLERWVSCIPQSLFTGLLWLDAVVILALLCFPLNGALLACAAILHLIQMKRHHLSFDGADEMVLVCLTALAVGSLGNSESAAALFIAAEAALAYFVAGIYKAASPYWKRGLALLLITRTRLFGQQRLSQALQRHPRITAALELIFVSWEVIFPVALIVPPRILFVFLMVGLLFHLSCAWVMGLNTFVWAFAATYPCIYFCNQQLRSMLTTSVADGLSLGVALVLGVAVALMNVYLTRRLVIAEAKFNATAMR